MLITSKGMMAITGLSTFVGEPVFDLSSVKKTNCTNVAGWGRKKSYFQALQYAQKKQIQAICLEDGFIRSVGLGKHGVPPLSIVLDQQGIYFDATIVSDLESHILKPENQEKNQRAKRAIDFILKHKITKYNQVSQNLELQNFSHHKNILVVDQTYGDQSIRYSGATARTFKKMLAQALKDHPTATIWLKVHPDVVAAKAKGHFKDQQLRHPNIRLCVENYNPIELLQQMDEVYVVSSQMGFEALLCQKKVHCFGWPWYAGWGLTQDHYAPKNILKGRRHIQRSLAHVFYCAYIEYARYISPITQQRCELETILQLLVPNLNFQSCLPKSLYCYGFSGWKKIFMTDFLQFSQKELHFNRWIKPVKTAHVIAWGKKARILKNANYPSVMTVEDGFVRSRGLGAELIRPYSLVFDDIGIYYDATTDSALEKILNKISLDALDIQRAENLKKSILELNITKYNVGVAKKLIRPQQAAKVILVVGQVEDDLSVQLGGVKIKRNLDLLIKVRELNPLAYIIYKPHPDVQAGLRLGRIEPIEILKYADHIEQNVSITECFEIIDELHTISSLSGFEALLRGIKVHCYGLPFYAGWGLTQDQDDCKRRQKKLTIVELVYGVLIEYAKYSLPVTRKYQLPLVNVEDVVECVAQEMQLRQSSPLLKSTFAKIRAKILFKPKIK